MSTVRTAQLSGQLIANTEERAEHLRKDAESERLARTKLEKEVASRRLTGEQKTKFADTLRQYPDPVGIVVVSALLDPDGYGISAKRYALYTQEESGIHLVKVSEHGLGLYYRPKEGRDAECEVSVWIREGWEWMLKRAFGLPCHEPEWFRLPVMRRIAISTPNVMAALRRIRRDQARPYNFSLSPVLVNLTNEPLTLLAPFEKDPAQWMTLPYVNIHDGTTHSLENPTFPVLVQTFEMVFQQYHGHREAKSSAPDGSLSKADTAGLLKRYPVTATSFYLIGKETERGWEQNDDVSTLMPSLVRYGLDTGIADEQLRKRLLAIPLAFLEFETGLSRHTIVRARRAQPVHPRSLRVLKNIVRRVPVRK